MRILFVAIHNSVHTCRWINQLNGQGWDIHLFPSWYGDTHADLRETTVHELFYRRPEKLSSTVKIKGLYWPFPKPYLSPGRLLAEHVMGMIQRSRGIVLPGFPSDLTQGIGSVLFPWPERVRRLAHLVKRLKPDIVQSLEIQHGAYLVLEAKKYLKGKFPPWVVNNWGNDIYLFGRLKEHEARIREVMASCEYYSCECERDVGLAREFGFKGKVLPVLPNCAGFNLDLLKQYRQPGLPSSRKMIFVKGYQDWHGRALVALRAIALCKDLLLERKYTVSMHSVHPDVKIAAEILSKETGISIDVGGYRTPEEMMRLHGQARVHIGLAISDGIAITSIESMAMGSLPIQSYTACSDEWIECGKNGFIVRPEDPEDVASALRKSILDDEFVDRAAEINARIAAERMDEKIIRPKAVEMYKSIFDEQKIKREGNR